MNYKMPSRECTRQATTKNTKKRATMVTQKETLTIPTSSSMLDVRAEEIHQQRLAAREGLVHQAKTMKQNMTLKFLTPFIKTNNYPQDFIYSIFDVDNI